MKKQCLLFFLLFSLVSVSAEVRIVPSRCAVVKDGKVFPLYGQVRLVDNFADLKVQLVDYFPDLKVQIVNYPPVNCGEVQIVDYGGDVTVQLVDFFPDITVQIVDFFPGLTWLAPLPEAPLPSVNAPLLAVQP